MSDNAGVIHALLQWVAPNSARASSHQTAPDDLAVVAAARTHRVAGLLARAWQQSNHWVTLTPQVRHALRDAVLREREAHAVLTQVTLQAATALDAAQIPFLLLKGSAVGPLFYPEPELRPMSDVDLLVPPARLHETLQALHAAGFDRPSQSDEAFWREVYYNMPLAAPGTAENHLEIHWGIAQRGRHDPDLEGLFARAQSIEIAGQRMAVLGREDLLLHQVLHHSYHYFETRLSWLLDIALLHRAPHDAELAIARAAAWGMTVPLALSAAQIEHVFPGTITPPYRELIARTRRVAWLHRLWPSDDPLALLAAGSRRRQLVIGLVTLEGPLRMVRVLAGYLWRTARFGDRAGIERLKVRTP